MAEEAEHTNSVEPHAPDIANNEGPTNAQEEQSGVESLTIQDDAVSEESDASDVHNRIITTIHDFCKFMTELYVPDDAVLVPPEGGWPDITKESFSRLGKADEVIEVLRHLTYLRQAGEAYEILPGSAMANWRHPAIVSDIKDGEPDHMLVGTSLQEETPPDVIGLMQGGRHCHMIMLDCSDATIYEHGTIDGGTVYPGWFEGDYPSIEAFFGSIKEKFIKMEQLPKGEFEVVKAMGERDTRLLEALKEAYTSYGWPDDLHKERCAEAVKKITESIEG